MKFKKDGKNYVIVLSRGEEVISSLAKFCKDEGISAAFFNAIGAVEKVEIGYYKLATKEYFFRREEGEFEVASMNGNVALVDDNPFIHAHAVLTSCDEKSEVIGAHVKKATVAVTLEIFLTVSGLPLSRVLDKEIGLKLLKM